MGAGAGRRDVLLRSMSPGPKKHRPSSFTYAQQNTPPARSGSTERFCGSETQAVPAQKSHKGTSFGASNAPGF